MTTTKKIVTKKLTMAALLPPLLLLLAGCAGVGEAAPLGQDELFVPVGQYVAVRPDTPTSETGTLLMAGETAFPSGPASNNPVPGDTVAISTTHCAQNRFFWKLPGGCCALIPKRVFGKVRTSAGRSSQSDDPATDLIRRQEQSRRPALQPQPVNVRGRVVDGISGNPIPGAQVFVRPATAGASGPVGPITTDAKGEFRATVIGGPNLNYTVSAAADGYLGATGSPFPTYGPGVTDLATGRPGLPVGLLLENGGVDVALVKAADLGAGNNPLVAVLTWNRYAKFQDLRFVGQWTNYATQSRGVVRQPGGPFYQIVADRTAPDVPGRPAVFATDRFFNQRELADDTISDSYAVLAGQAFFFTKTGFLGSARPPFDVNSGWNLFIIDAGSYVTYPIWHPASYSSASDRLTLIPTEASMYPEPSLQSMEDVL